MQSVSNYIDHTNLNQIAKNFDIEKLCKVAIDNNFAAVCINPVYVPLASDILNGQSPKVCTVVGFPIGADSTEMKFAESRYLTHQGAEELDMVINIAAIKEKDIALVKNEIVKIVDAADGNCVKVIIETCLLTDDEIKLSSEIAMDAGAHFIKTSTGFSLSGATEKDVKLIRKIVGLDMRIKASGGIKTLSDLKKLVKAGADRIGTSNAISIINE